MRTRALIRSFSLLSIRAHAPREFEARVPCHGESPVRLDTHRIPKCHSTAPQPGRITSHGRYAVRAGQMRFQRRGDASHRFEQLPFQVGLLRSQRVLLFASLDIQLAANTTIPLSDGHSVPTGDEIGGRRPSAAMLLLQVNPSAHGLDDRVATCQSCPSLSCVELYAKTLPTRSGRHQQKCAYLYIYSIRTRLNLARSR